MRAPEWERHERTLLAWRAEAAAVANAVVAFEPVTVLCASDADAAAARAAVSASCEVVVRGFDGPWLRAGGSADAPYDGSAVTADGTGRVATTEAFLLGPERNPDLDRDDLEAVLARDLGADRVLWLGEGLREDPEGRVDHVALFVGPGRLLLQVVAEEDPNFDGLEENRRRAVGAGLDVLEVAWLPRLADRSGVVSYLQACVVDGGVVVPLSGVPEDDERALAVYAAAFGDREVVGVDGVPLAAAGLGPRRVTLPVLAA